MRRILITVLIWLIVAVVFGTAGCGGGGGGGDSGATATTTPGDTTIPTAPGDTTNPTAPGNVSASTVSGTASEGALITGKTVTLKDANGVVATAISDTTTGAYSIDVTNLTAPFLITITGTNGTYISLAQTAGTANINPITTMVVALAAGTCDVSALFTSLTPVQLATINTNYAAKCVLVTASLQAALPAGFKAEDYFTGTVTAGTGMDAIFDTYQITFDPAAGITVTTKDGSTVLAIPAATVTANANQPLPTINAAPIASAGPAQSVVVGSVVTLDGSASSDANGDSLTYNWAFTSKPSGSGATLSSATAVKPTFTADVTGTYVISLVVNDGKVNSDASSVRIASISSDGIIVVEW